MRRFSALLLIFLLPLAAAGQTVGAENAMANHLLAQPQQRPADAASGVVVPLWRDAKGYQFSLTLDDGTGQHSLLNSSLMGLRAVDANKSAVTGLQYGAGLGLQAHAEVSQYSWANSRDWRVVGSEVGATYDAGHYSVGLSVGSTSTPNVSNRVALPRVLLGAMPGIDGLSSFDSSSQLNARGRLALGSQSGIDLGASVGRIHLLPGNLLGVDTLDQKALSFGVDHGPLSGVLTGRTMQPQAGLTSNLGADRRWNSIDLGVTWRLPWRGSVSVGAQNLWSSGTPSNTPVGPEPDQSRTPYVQYHQDL
jgi:hypothetical protein